MKNSLINNENVKFSIVIPTYNRALKLRECICSIIAQTYTNWEAIIVDNFSDDNTEEIVQSFKDDRLFFIKNHNNGIIAISRNKALDIATGDWICFLDSDDSWKPNKLDALLPYVKEYDLIYHGYRRKFEIKSWGNILKRNNCYFYNVKEATLAYVLQRGDPFNPSCTCVSKKCLGSIRFSEDPSLFAVEDYDFFLKILEKNIRIKYLRKALTIYDLSGCSHDGNSAKRDEEIIKRWIHKLNEDDVEEVNNQVSFRRANDLMNTQNYKVAATYYKEVMNSKLCSKKYYSIRNYIFCKILALFHDTTIYK